MNKLIILYSVLAVAFARMGNSIDSSSYGNIEEIRTKSLDLNLTVDLVCAKQTLTPTLTAGTAAPHGDLRGVGARECAHAQRTRRVLLSRQRCQAMLPLTRRPLSTELAGL